jgi:hypothetical protein
VNPDPSAEHEHAPPPASFETLVRGIVMQAQLALVSFEDEKGSQGPELQVARHYIDLLCMLAEKTKGNLALDENRLLENSLTELRFRYVQAFEESRRKSASQTESAPA